MLGSHSIKPFPANANWKATPSKPNPKPPNREKGHELSPTAHPSNAIFVVRAFQLFYRDGCLYSITYTFFVRLFLTSGLAQEGVFYLSDFWAFP